MELISNDAVSLLIATENVCWTYLSTGTSFRNLAFSFRMGNNTVRRIIKENVLILWDELQPLHMPVTTTE
ncbi:hypothetical protein PR048_003904 [Dryococelus australis]|uniref:Transposase n=1 Tax=Dryococelus australis TaxID=614101 RepID=A0ABQ9IPA6_9NEOP|nr:hypothetical protein PR048_003904 [Dryococelus australis]